MAIFAAADCDQAGGAHGGEEKGRRFTARACHESSKYLGVKQARGGMIAINIPAQTADPPKTREQKAFFWSVSNGANQSSFVKTYVPAIPTCLA